MLERWCQRYRVTAIERQRAQEFAQKAQTAVEASAEEELLRRGFRLAMVSLSVPGAVVLARIDLKERYLYLDPQSLALLSRRLVQEWGEDYSDTAWAQRMAIAHELFHLLCPQAVGVVGELGAHFFVQNTLQLPGFVGSLV